MVLVRSGSRRFAALAAAVTLIGALLTPMARADAPQPGSTVPNPVISQPPVGLRGHPLWDSWYDLAPFHYEEHEFFVSGTATDPSSGAKAPYTTRIIVSRPQDPHDFNGTAVLDWTNVTAQFENAVDTMETRQMLMREGFAYVHVSAQAAGLCCTPLTPKVWDPVRYSAINHPGDAYADDIFSQVAKAIRYPTTDNGNIDATSGIHVARLIAVGQSQSCSKLATYVTSTQNTARLIDGFLIHGCDAGKTTSAASLNAKVLHLLSDNEANPADPKANDNYRLWEIAGTAHSDYFIGYQSEVGSGARVLADQPQQSKQGYDDVMREAGNYGAELHPLLAACIVAGSTVPMHYADSAAVYALDRWLRDAGDAPPNGPRFAFTNGALAKDADRNTIGGIRMPPMDHAVATYDSTQCPLGGLTIPFTDAQIQQRYPDFDRDYYAPMAASTDAAVRAGWILRTDAFDMMNRVCAAQNRWGRSNHPCAAYVPPPSPWGNTG